MIDIYALIAKQLHTVLIDDEERIPLNGRALGFVVPTGCS